MKKSKMHSPQISSFEDFKLERNKLNLNRKLIESKMEFSFLFLRNTLPIPKIDSVLSILKTAEIL